MISKEAKRIYDKQYRLRKKERGASFSKHDPVKKAEYDRVYREKK